MKVICNTISLRKMDISDLIPTLGKLEIKDLELHADFLLDKSIDYKKFNKDLNKYNIKIYVFSGGWCNFLTKDISENIESMQKQIDIMKKINCNKIRIFLGQMKNEDYTEEAGNKAVKDLTTLSKTFPKITFLMENENGVNSNPDILYSIMSRVNKPNILLNYDFANMEAVGYNSFSNFKKLKDFVGHIHIKGILNKKDRKYCEYGKGILDYTEIFNYLKEIDYNKLISSEYEGDGNKLEGLKNCFFNLKKDIEKLNS